MASTVTLFPVPGTYQDRPLVAWIGAAPYDCSRWSEIRAWAAWFFAADEDDIDLSEIYFGGEYGDDDSREVLTVKGEIVGVFDEALTTAEWSALFDADATERRSLSAEVREAARARAAQSAN